MAYVSKSHDEALEELAIRLARVEAKIFGPGNDNILHIRASSSDGGSPERRACPMELWQRVLKASKCVEEYARRMGEKPVLNELETELFNAPHSLSRSAFRRKGFPPASINQAAAPPDGPSVPPPSSNVLVGIPEKTTLLLAKEEETRRTLARLSEIDELKAFISGPFLEGGRHREEAALYTQLQRVERDFWDVEAVAFALAREMEEVLTVYDEVVERLSGKCVEWEGVLAARWKARKRGFGARTREKDGAKGTL